MKFFRFPPLKFSRRSSVVILCAVLSAVGSFAVTAQTLEKALEAYDFEEYQDAAKWLRPFADGGHAEAQYRMGKMCEGGRGIEQSIPEAKKWYQKAAAQGHVGARRRLEAIEGKPSKASGDSVALKWYQDKADEGDPDAQYNLGFMYETGFSVPRDDGRAAQWYELAAARRDVPAQLRLGLMYLAGAGVKQSEIQAVKWIESAAERGNKLAIAVETLLLTSNQELGLDKPVIADRIRAISAKDEARAITVLKSTIQEARVKFEREKKERETLLIKRKGIESAMAQDPDIEFGLDAQGRRTIAWYKRNAEHGSAMAQFQLGRHYELGQDVPVDMKEAVRWFDTAAQQGYPDAQYYLGMLTLYGIGVEKNEVLGQSLVKAAAGQGHADARRALERIGATPALEHYSMAVWWLTRHGQEQDGMALQHAGSLYDQGRGVPVDHAEAQRFLKKGLALGTSRQPSNVEVAPSAGDSEDAAAAVVEPPPVRGAARARRAQENEAPAEPVPISMGTRLAIFGAFAAIPIAVFLAMYSKEKKRIEKRVPAPGQRRTPPAAAPKSMVPTARPARKREANNPFK